jgi:hypothetical protein
MNRDEAREKALEVLKPFDAELATAEFLDRDSLVDEIAKAIAQAYEDGWDRGTR